MVFILPQINYIYILYWLLKYEKKRNKINNSINEGEIKNKTIKKKILKYISKISPLFSK